LSVQRTSIFTEFKNERFLKEVIQHVRLLR
jgi:hypothetical protein